MRKKSLQGFTLVEILITVIITGILAAVGASAFNFIASKEHAIGKEAIANLKLIQIAEKIYQAQTGSNYYPSSGSVNDPATINTNLKLSLTETNWDYSINGGVSNFTAYAQRIGSGAYSSCRYYISESANEAGVLSGTCP